MSNDEPGDTVCDLAVTVTELTLAPTCPATKHKCSEAAADTALAAQQLCCGVCVTAAVLPPRSPSLALGCSGDMRGAGGRPGWWSGGLEARWLGRAGRGPTRVPIFGGPPSRVRSGVQRVRALFYACSALSLFVGSGFVGSGWSSTHHTTATTFLLPSISPL